MINFALSILNDFLTLYLKKKFYIARNVFIILTSSLLLLHLIMTNLVSINLILGCYFIIILLSLIEIYRQMMEE